MKNVIYIPRQGLANRLRGLASSYILSKHLNLNLILDWKKEECCNIEFSDLFTNKFEKYDVNKHKADKNLFKPNIHTEKLFRIISKDDFNNYDNLMITGGHEFKYPDINEEEFIQQKSNFYKLLVPIDIINNKIEDILAQYDFSNLIGVHYRDYYEKYDSKDKLNFSNFAPIDTCLELMNVHYEKIKEKNMPLFFISTNSEKSKSLITNKFKNKCFILEINNFDRNNIKDVQIALLEWYLLSKCKYIIGSYMSSFSDEASFVNINPKYMFVDSDNDRFKGIKYHCYGLKNNNNKFNLNYP